MWKQKIGISILNNYCIPTNKVIEILKNTGFDAVSPVWKAEEDLSEIVYAAHENELFIQSLHAPNGKIADMWSKNEDVSARAKNEILSALVACVKFNIPILVLHAWKGFDYSFEVDTLNFTNFDEIVSFAKEHNIKIAFENSEGEEYLFALMNHFQNNDTVGFCWDSGHEMCYNHSKDLLSKYGNRLIMTHLNDNLGISRFDGKTFWTDDLHLLPYDGVANWDYNIERLKNSNKLDILIFEFKIRSKPNQPENDIYEKMSIELFFTEAYKRACKIAYRYSN